MLLGPIFQVEMVSTARRGRYFLLRVIYGALILFLLWTAYESTSALGRYSTATSLQTSSRLATIFFYSFSWLQMLAIVSIGPAMAVGTVAAERERRTIEYLFATDLSDFEIIFGKTVARLLLLGQIVAVGMPILFLFRLLGGIPANVLLGTFLLAASAALMLTAIGVCVSVWSARARDATVRVYIVLAALFLLPGVLRTFGTQVWGANAWWSELGEPLTEALLVINPIYMLGVVLFNPNMVGLGLDMRRLLESVGWQCVVAALALGWATFAVRRVHLNAASRGDTVKRGGLKPARWRPALAERPMLWKEMYAGASRTRLGLVGTLAVILILLTTYGITLYQFQQALSSRRWSRPEDYFTYLAVLTGLLGSGMLLVLGARAAGLITLERERDCWISLMSTPLTGREILDGKIVGNLYAMRWLLAVLASTWLLGIWINLGFVYPALAMAITFFLAAAFVTNLGLAYSLSAKSTLRSMAATLGTLVFTSGGYLFFCCMILAVTGGFGRGQEAVLFAPCIPFLLAWPAVAFYEYVISHQFGREEGFIIAYFFGVVLYLVATALLYGFTVGRFNHYAGRCDRAEAT